MRVFVTCPSLRIDNDPQIMQDDWSTTILNPAEWRSKMPALLVHDSPWRQGSTSARIGR